LKYIEAYHGFARKIRKGDAITFSRAGFTGAGAFPGHWAGDEVSTWEGMRSSILAGQNAAVSGVPFWGWDLAGFSGDVPCAELYLRAAAAAAFCPIMQYHSDFNNHELPNRDRTPWNIQERTNDERVIPVFRDFANLRMNLLPNIVDIANKAIETGIPMIRPMSFMFPGDNKCLNYPYQYFLGDDMLVCPVVSEAVDLWKVYLPEGVWFDFWTGKKFEGADTFDIKARIDRIPVFLRSGSIVPVNLGSDLTFPEAVGNSLDTYSHLSFVTHPDRDSAFEWYDFLSRKKYPFDVKRIQSRIELSCPALPYDFNLLVRSACPEDVISNGKPVQPREPAGSLLENVWEYRVQDSTTIVQFPRSVGKRRVVLRFE
jgi:alpha-glucosidase (family GH31 glycosyl hydrolase)